MPACFRGILLSPRLHRPKPLVLEKCISSIRGGGAKRIVSNVSEKVCEDRNSSGSALLRPPVPKKRTRYRSSAHARVPLARSAKSEKVLHISAKNSQSFALKLLLSAIPAEQKEGVVNTRNVRGQTALHNAVRAGDPDSVHYLLSHGAATNILDNHKNTVVHYLADAYNEAIFKEILEAPASSESDFNALNEEGFAPLHLAVRRLKLSLIEMLLEGGAAVNAADHASRTALLHAVNMNDVEIVQFLLSKGADPNVEDESGETPLLLCVKTANYAIMGLLIDAGADPQKKIKTILH
ncbi:ankyrin repeat protein [Ancylostoma duodenale]|uniref:Ankyrin repeat protein n=1 Tax=Ancylostoma duodenale TaxID=51022 RepID=A0A0C2D1D9_9BILA|nr:ankyrin repeat protein [Ancylostoma duodenale]